MPPYLPPDGAVPPDEVRFTRLSAEPWEDGKRVRVNFALTPFQQPPNITLTLENSEGLEITRASIIESIEDSITFTMHIRTPNTDGEYQLRAVVGYESNQQVDTCIQKFQICSSTKEME